MIDATAVQEAEPSDEYIGDHVFVEGWTHENGVPKFFTVQDKNIEDDGVQITVRNRDDLDEVYQFRVVDDTETVEYRELADDWQVLDSHLVLDEHNWKNLAWDAYQKDEEAMIPHAGLGDDIIEAAEQGRDLVLYERRSMRSYNTTRWHYCDCHTDPKGMRGPDPDDEDVRAVFVGHAKGGTPGWYGFAEKLVVFEDHPAVTHIERYPKDPYSRPKKVIGFGGVRNHEYPSGYEPKVEGE